MEFEKIEKPSYSRSITPSGLEILIPTKKSRYMLLLYGFVFIILLLYSFFLIYITKQVYISVEEISKISDITFADFWILPISISICLPIYWAIFLFIWLRLIKGFEVIKISGNSFILEKKIPFWTRSKRYNLENVKALRISNTTASIWNMPGGSLSFDYGAKTVRFGIGLDEAEARMILIDIQQKYPEIMDS